MKTSLSTALLLLVTSFSCIASDEAPVSCRDAYAAYTKDGFSAFARLYSETYDDTLKQKAIVVVECLRFYYNNREIYFLLYREAEGGDVDASKILGLLLVSGIFYTKNEALGLELLKKAALQDEEAKEVLDLYLSGSPMKRGE